MSPIHGLLAAFLVMPGIALAGWTTVGRGPAGTVYYDRATLVENGELRRISELFDFKEKRPNGAQSQLMEVEYDCAKRRLRLLSVVSFPEPMGSGKGTKMAREDDPWSEVKPGTIAATVLPRVCVSIPPANRARWEKVTESSEATFFVDADSVSNNETTRRVWELYDRKAKAPDASFRMWNEYDCKEQRARTLIAIVYTGSMAGGEILEMNPDAGEWAPVKPNTPRMATMKYACSR